VGMDLLTYAIVLPDPVGADTHKSRAVWLAINGITACWTGNRCVILSASRRASKCADMFLSLCFLADRFGEI
jgi:hypothetical protein